MDNTQEELTITTLGEMYVKWRLSDGIIYTYEDRLIRYNSKNGKTRMITANDFCRETGRIMLPYLSSHPDVGFIGFCLDMRDIARFGVVYSHCSALTDEFPHKQIIRAVEKTYADFVIGKPNLLLIYIQLRHDQKIQLFQYACMKAHIQMALSPRRISIYLACLKEHKYESQYNGLIRIWIS